MRIADETIGAVRDAVDIVDVVGDYVRLKKRGSNFVGLCPFHSEKTPSFNVNPGLDIYKCFGCGEGGDVFSFISAIDNLTFPEAVRAVAERCGIVIPESEEESEEGSVREAIYQALQFAARFFHDNLTGGAAGEHAREYLEKRQISTEMVKRFGIGYSLDAWDGLLEAATKASISEDVLQQAGLILPRRDGSGYYDRYRDRLIFPILSHVGRVLGFGGRLLSSAEDQPKYINSPETDVYHKGSVLYGLFRAKNSIRAKEEAVLVEGYTDIVALHQAGVEHVVASSGTALTGDQVKLIGRYAKRIILMYDGDQAGARATVRGIDLLLQSGMAPYVVALPDGEDPDTYVRTNGAEAFEMALRERRQDFVTYLHGRARDKGNLEEPDSRANVHHKIMQLVARIPDQLMRESYVQRAAAVLGVPDMYLRRAMEADRRTVARKARKPATESAPEEKLTKVPASEPNRETIAQPLPEEKTLLRLMLDHGSPMISFILSRTALDEFTTGASRQAAEALVRQFEKGEFSRKPFLDGRLGAPVQRLIAEIMTDQEEPSSNWEKKKQIVVPRFNEDARAAASGAMTLLKLDRLDEMIAKLRHELHEAEKTGKEVRPLQEELVGLQQLRRRIANREFLK